MFCKRHDRIQGSPTSTLRALLGFGCLAQEPIPQQPKTPLERPISQTHKKARPQPRAQNAKNEESAPGRQAQAPTKRLKLDESMAPAGYAGGIGGGPLVALDTDQDLGFQVFTVLGFTLFERNLLAFA